MPYNGIADGLHMVVCRSSGKLVDHYGALDVGNRTGLQGPHDMGPIVIHLNTDGLKWEYVESSGRQWTTVGSPSSDEAAAIARMNTAAMNPTYDLLVNNCEQFARWAITGKRESKQLQAAGWLTAGAALAYILTRPDSDDDDASDA